MPTVIRRVIGDVQVKPAVLHMDDLLSLDSKVRDVRYVQTTETYYIFTERGWREFAFLIQ